MTSTPRDETGPLAGAPPGEGVTGTARRRLLADRLATGVVNAGGFAVVVSLVGILAFLLWETLPLFGNAVVVPKRAAIAVETAPVAVLIDPHQTHVATLDKGGRLSVVAVDSGAEVARLSLSDDATANALPQLEIYADDVRCSHGATTGLLDQESLFYLRARGISKPVARKMLIGAFVNEVVDQIDDQWLRDRFKQILDRFLDNVAL